MIDRRGTRAGPISIPKTCRLRAMSLASLVIVPAAGPNFASTLTPGAICKIAFAALRYGDALGGRKIERAL
jgi:hypothetical protein